MILDLSIKNYKSIEEMSLSFGEINAFIGKNGAGKSTLISAINVLKRVAAGDNINRIINDIAPLDDFFNCNLDGTTAEFRVKIQTRNGGVFLYSFDITFGPFRNRLLYRFSRESLHKIVSNGEELIFRRNNTKSGISKESGQGEDLEIASGVTPLKVDSSVSVLSMYAQDDARVVADTIASYCVIWLDDTMNNSNNSVVYSNSLDLNTIDGVAIDLYTRDSALYEEAIHTIGIIIPGFKPPEITRIGKTDSISGDSAIEDPIQKVSAYIVNWSDSAYAKTSSISRFSLSGGNSRVIFLILSLYNSRNRSCFVAEEIENGMHLSRISRLIDQLKMIIKNRKIQFFFTTHNHLILEDLLPKEVIYVHMNTHGSQYTRLSETEEFVMVREALGRTPSSSDVVNSGLLFQ